MKQTTLDKLDNMPELAEALTGLWESLEMADGDLGGEQREWHLPRIRNAVALLTGLFPLHSARAMSNAKYPDGSLIS